MSIRASKVQLSSNTALVLALFYTASAAAQTADQPPAPPPVVKPATAQSQAVATNNAALEEEDGDAIVVSGIRASLESALDIRRNAEVILDGISSDDVGSTPDLNLGEALQRIPGVQIDRSAERRDATISVRGLPGRFTRTTLMGQLVAPAALNNNNSAFGIFDAAIFSGANVIKSFSADTSSGGLAANVDLRLKSALERPKSSFVLRGEMQYEESIKKFNPSLFWGFSQHLTDGFAVYGNLAFSKQRFRRDRIGINTYGAFNRGNEANEASTNATTRASVNINGYDETRLANPSLNLTDFDRNTTQVLFPGDVRQEVRQEEGQRISGSAGLALELSDDMTFRFDGIYSRRKLDSSVQDNLYYAANDTDGQALPLVAPILVGTYSRGTIVNGVAPPVRDIYVVPSVRYTDVGVDTGIRNTPANTYSWGLYPQLNFKNDDWNINLIGVYSKAEYSVIERQNEVRSRQITGAANRITAPNTAQNILEVTTGLDNYRDFSMNLITDERIFDFTGYNWLAVAGDSGVNLNRPVNTPIASLGGARLPQLSFLLAGANRGVKRNLYSMDSQIERFLDFGPFTSIEIGAHFDKESAISSQEANAGVGLNFNALTTGIYNLNVAQQAGNYFGNLIPGAEGDNFRSFDVDQVNSILLPASPSGLFPTGTTAANYTQSSVSDTYLTRASLLRDSAQALRNFTTNRKNFEFYSMVRFDLDKIAHSPIRGNFGLRYVKTKLDGILDQDLVDLVDDKFQTARAGIDIFLPSVNVVANITDTLVLRGAWYRSFDAFDLGEFTPAPTILTTSIGDLDGDGGFDDISAYNVNVSSLDLEPRTGDAFDLSLSWYNRKGSLFGIAYFHKVFDDVARQQLCQVGDSPYGVPAPLFVDAFNVCRSNVNGLSDVNNPRVTINRTVNLPNPLFIRGYEFQAQQKLDFLPGFWKGFGTVLNATHVTSKSKDPNRKLFNVADWTVNLIGYYENSWLSTRLAYNWQSEYDLEGAGSSTGGDRRVQARGQLDFTMGIKPMKNLELRFEAFNITNAIRKEFEENTLLPRRYDWDGRSVSLSAQVRF